MFDYIIYQLFTLGFFALAVHFNLKAFLKLKFVHQILLVVVALSVILLFPRFKEYQKQFRLESLKSEMVGVYISESDSATLVMKEDMTWSLSGLEHKCNFGEWSVRHFDDKSMYVNFIGRCGKSDVFHSFINTTKSVKIPVRSIFERPTEKVVLHKVQQ